MAENSKPQIASSECSPHAAADTVLMVRPAAFLRNEVTRPTNRFQSDAVSDPAITHAHAIAEFDACAVSLRRLGIRVLVFPGRTTLTMPDEIFPNNWLTTHPDGTVVLYPLMAWNRRAERRRDILAQLQTRTHGFRIDRLVDLSDLEADKQFLEGTGSLVFDHANRLAYACVSPRTRPKALKEFARRVDYDVVAFSATDRDGHAIYHTNVMLSVGERFAFICADAIGAVTDRLRVLTRLERSGREVITFTRDQMHSFVGNILQLRAANAAVIVLSRQAAAALDDAQREALAGHGQLVAVNVATIEANGGGSVRCMLAEILLPKKAGARIRSDGRGT